MPPALARRSSAKTSRGSALKYAAAAEPVGQLLEHRQVVQHALRWRQRPAAADHPALEVGHGALLLRPLGARQHHVGQLGGLGEEDVGDHQQVQGAEALADPVDVGCGDDDVRGHQQQDAYAARRAHPVEHLEGGQSRLGQLVGVDPPDGGHVSPVGRVGQLAVARQLVGLLAVLAAALPVALPGDGAVAGERPADQPEGQRQVDVGLGGVGALGVLLGTSGGEDHRRSVPRPGCARSAGARRPGRR